MCITESKFGQRTDEAERLGPDELPDALDLSIEVDWLASGSARLRIEARLPGTQRALMWWEITLRQGDAMTIRECLVAEKILDLD